MSLGDYVQRAAHEDTFRLKGIELWVPTDEQLAKGREKFPEGYAHVSLKVTWEPLTYRKFIGEDEIKEEVDYIRVTKGKGLSVGDEAATLAIVRAGGFPAIPADVRLNAPDPRKADPDKQPQAFQRFYVAAGRAGIVIDVDDDGTVTGKPGQLYTKQVGKIFSCRNGSEDFPTVNVDPVTGLALQGKDFWNWEDTRSVFMRVPMKEVTDFAQPEQVPERRYERKEEAEGAGTVGVTTTAAPAALSVDSLRAAVGLLGISGKTVSVVNASATSLVVSNIAKAPAVLGAGEVNRAAQSGKFVDWLVEQGVATVQDGVVNVG